MKKFSFCKQQAYLLSFFLVGCAGSMTSDLSHISDFDRLNFAVTDSSLSSQVDLFIDYSTCVAEAANSPYYQAVHPAIVDCNPTFWSIKGPVITEETRDRQKVYELLRSIQEVNNAEIKDAVGQIVHGHNQAVLITDGEYFMPGLTGDNLNNPYLADHFRTWLKRGYDIYLYSEPYVESGKFEKYRYYMLFTDSKLENNIQQRFERSAPKDSQVRMFHLTNALPTITFSKEYPDVNPTLSFNSESYQKANRYDVQEYQTSWKDIYKYIWENAADEMGNPLPQGDYILKGSRIETQPTDAYHFDEVALSVEQVYAPYQQLCDSIATHGRLVRTSQFPAADRIFVVDEKQFQRDGSIVVRLDPTFDGSTLSAEPNLLKVDLVLKEAHENFSQNEALNRYFKWTSISAKNNGQLNTSLYQSINQVLLDPSINPARREHPVIYSVYLNTLSK